MPMCLCSTDVRDAGNDYTDTGIRPKFIRSLVLIFDGDAIDETGSFSRRMTLDGTAYGVRQLRGHLTDTGTYTVGVTEIEDDFAATTAAVG